MRAADNRVIVAVKQGRHVYAWVYHRGDEVRLAESMLDGWRNRRHPLGLSRIERILESLIGPIGL